MTKSIQRKWKGLRSKLSTGTPTKEQAARFVALKYLGCVACILRGQPAREPDVHHLLSGGRRRGHDYTIPLCEWHHRAQPPSGMFSGECRIMFGPSLAEGSKTFHAEFGSDDFLLSETNRRLDEKDAVGSIYTDPACLYSTNPYLFTGSP